MLTDVIEYLRQRYALEPGDEGIWYGQIKDQAVILLPLDAEKPCLLVKMRLKQSVPEQEDISSTLNPDDQKSIELTVNNAYAWLTINDVTRLENASQVEIWILKAIESLRQRNLLATQACHLCGNTASTTLMHDGLGDIANVCDKCRFERMRELEHQAFKVKETSTSAWGLLLFMGAITALVWTLIWTAYDYAFELMGKESIAVPDIVLVLFSVLVALALTGPMIWVSRAKALGAKISGRVILAAVLLLSLGVGEITYWTLAFYKETKLFVPIAIFQSILLLLQDCHGLYLVLKGVTAVIAIAILWKASKVDKPTPSLDLKTRE